MLRRYLIFAVNLKGKHNINNKNKNRYLKCVKKDFDEG